MKLVSAVIPGISAALLLSSFAPAASAYEFLKAAKDPTQPVRWWAGRPAYTWTLSTVEPGEGSWADIQGLVETAFDAWIDTPCGLVPDFSFAGTSAATGWTRPETLADTPDNVVVFVTSRAQWQTSGNMSSWLAITKVASDEVTGQIVDTDIEINDGMYTYHYGEGAPASGEIDFRAMIIHEVGHFYGMDHSKVAGATMDGAYASGNPVDARTLDQDDVDGICALYTDVPQWVDPTVKPPGSGDDGGCESGAGRGLLGGLLGLLAIAFGRRRSIGRIART